MACGKIEPQSRSSIAEQFGVSIGMLEHGFRGELNLISILFAKIAKERREESKRTLQHKMNIAVQRCGSKGRPWDWPHVFAELKDVNFHEVSQRELDASRDKAIKKYKGKTQKVSAEVRPSTE